MYFNTFFPACQAHNFNFFKIIAWKFRANLYVFHNFSAFSTPFNTLSTKLLCAIGERILLLLRFFSSTTIKNTNSLQEKMQTVCAGKIIRRMYEESKFLIPTECPKFDNGRNGHILSSIANNGVVAVPLKAAAKPSALRGQYERRLLVAKPPPAMHCRHCKIVDFAIEPSITQSAALRLLILCDFFQYHVYPLFLSIPDNGQRDSIAGIAFIFIVIQLFCGLNCIIINRCNDVTNL